MGLPFAGRVRRDGAIRARCRRRATGRGPRPSAEILEPRQLLAQVFTVTDTLDDTNPGSLRWAIGQVNADTTDTAASPDQIHFAIPTTDPGYNSTTGVWTIAPTSALPTVTRPVVIDGYTQAGASPNSAMTSDNAVLTIDLKSQGVQGDGLAISGGSSTVEGLAIGGFDGAGIHLMGGGGDVVAGDFLGTDAGGLSGDDDYQGVLAESSNNTIGGMILATRNVVASNTYEDISLVSHLADNLIAGNFVGLVASGRSALGGAAFGIYIAGGPGNTVGGTAAAARNVVAGQDFDCILDVGFVSDDVIEGNYIGTDADGTSSLAQPFYFTNGISCSGQRDTIGGTAAGAGNLISGNSGYGIAAGGDSSQIVGNLIGVSPSGTQALANVLGGILLDGPNLTIGGIEGGAGNVISGNGLGIRIDGGAGDSILGNRIGTDVTGSLALGNTSDGIQILNGTPVNLIGGAAPGARNTIAFNAGAGVNLPGNSNSSPPIGVEILSNSIHDNAKLGIDLGGDGVTPNTPGGPHVGPNLLQNYPVLTAADSSGTSTTILGTLNSTPNATFTVQFFANPTADPSGYGQGQTYLGQLTGVTTDASGNATFSFVAPVAVKGQFLSATATDAGGSTSEFARDIQEGTVPLADLAVSVLNSTASTDLRGLVVFTFQVTNLGPDAATNVAVVDTLPASLKDATIVASEGQSTIVGGTFTDLVASLPVGGSFTVAVTGVPVAAGTLTNSLVAAAAEADPDPSNNTATVAIPVAKTPSVTGLLTAPNPSTVGQPVGFLAYVAGLSSFPTGTVTFSVDGVPTATVPVVADPVTGKSTAPFSTSTLAAGSHVIVAHYNGDANTEPSDSVAVIQDVVRPTATTLLAAPNPATVGQPVTFAATVAPASPQDGPTGVVTFFLDGVGHVAPVVPSADGLTGTATFTTSALAPGTHTAVAQYDGDANFATSVSATIVETINPVPPPPVGPPPRAVEVLRYGYHAMPTQLVVEFNEPLDAATAQNPANYAIVGPRGLPIPILSATLESGGTAVVLRPSGRLDVHDVYTLMIAGGVKGASGVAIGSEQVELITLRNLTWRRTPPVAPSAARAKPSPHAVDALLAAEYRAHLRATAAHARRR